jgi:hypothetical protein
MFRLFFSILLIFFVSQGFSQIQIITQFGAQVEYVTENGTSGCKVLQVVRGTSVALKLQEKDLIFKIGNSTFASTEEFTQQFLTYSPNQEIQLTVLRGKEKLILKAKASARPYETDDNATVVYDEVAYKGGQLRVIINKPFKENKMPAMLFIPGYSCSSIDELPPSNPYKRIVDAYVDAGYVTLRIEKSGLGDSKNTPPCESCDLLNEIESFEQGLIKLKSLPYVDSSQIIIYGYAIGGIISPALSAKHKVAGVVVYGTTAKSWFEYQLEMHRLTSTLAGMSPIDIEQSARAQYDINYRYFVKKETLEDIAKDPVSDSILRFSWEYDGKGKIYSRNAEYWRQIQDFPLLENWKNTSSKVLVQFGESDFHGFSKADHQQIVNTVNYFNPGNASLITFPLTDHLFAKSGTMQQAYNQYANGLIKQLWDAYNPAVGHSAVKWSNKVLGINDENLLSAKKLHN